MPHHVKSPGGTAEPFVTVRPVRGNPRLGRNLALPLAAPDDLYNGNFRAIPKKFS